MSYAQHLKCRECARTYELAPLAACEDCWAPLEVAYRAYQTSLHGRAAPIVDGYTGPQRFFLAWAQVWRTKVRPEYAPQAWWGFSQGCWCSPARLRRVCARGFTIRPS